MRIIEKQMNEAIADCLNWKNGNTEVISEGSISRVFLYGNQIATIGENFVQLFDGGHQTATTKSRINAICDAHAISGEGVFQKAGTWYVKQYNGPQLGWETVKFRNGIMLGEDSVPVAC